MAVWALICPSLLQSGSLYITLWCIGWTEIVPVSQSAPPDALRRFGGCLIYCEGTHQPLSVCCRLLECTSFLISHLHCFWGKKIHSQNDNLRRFKITELGPTCWCYLTIWAIVNLSLSYSRLIWYSLLLVSVKHTCEVCLGPDSSKLIFCCRLCILLTRLKLFLLYLGGHPFPLAHPKNIAFPQ